MKKIRIGNDFVFAWEIERNGLPEDLSSVLEKHLHLSVFGKRVELVEGVDYDIIGNVIRIEVTPTIANIIGTYRAEFNYILPDNGLIDEDRKCAVDVDAFQIVARTAQADDPSEFTVTSDMAIAFKGDKGDSAYQVWLDAGNTGTEEDYFAYLRQPAVDAGASISELEGEIQISEGLRVQAESERVQAEVERQNTIQEAVTATNLANEKANLANDAAQNANEAADSALTATQEATTAASLADTARLAIQDDLELKANQTDLEQLADDVKETTEKPTAQSLSELNARITALEAIITNKIKDRIDVTKEFNVWGKTNLILMGSGAAAFAPDFVGQKYIDTTGGNVYVAVGVSNAGNWKLV